MHLANPVTMVVTTGLAMLLSLAGIVVSIVALSFIVIGCVGCISFCRKLGSSHTYQLNGQATLRIDNFVLTISYPGSPESLVDLNLLAAEDQRQLLALLHKRWMPPRCGVPPSAKKLCKHSRLPSISSASLNPSTAQK
jgi:hypothetical protein